MALLSVQNEYGVLESVVNGIGASLGFLLAIVLMAGIREKLENSNIPEAFKGTPIVLITAGLIVRKAFAEEHPDALAAFLKEYQASTAYINEHVEEGAALVEKYDIVKAAVAKQAIPACNITYLDGEDMKTALSGYLQILFEQNPQAVGGAMPGDDFYLVK